MVGRDPSAQDALYTSNQLTELHVSRDEASHRLITTTAITAMNRLPRRQASNSQSIGTFLAGATTGEDGTTYKETTFRVRRSTWATSGTTTLVRPLQPKSKDGAQSLEFYARKFINSRAWDLDRTVLHHIPWKFGKMLWDDAVAT